MKKKNIPSTDAVLDFIGQVEKDAERGNIPKAFPSDASFEVQMKYSL
jgi:hypothetical protein